MYEVSTHIKKEAVIIEGKWS